MTLFPSRQSRAARRPPRRARGISLWVLIAVAMSLLTTSVSWAGTCNETFRTYKVTGTATPLDWTWQIGHPLGGANPPTVSTVLALTNNLLNPGDPPRDIIDEFVKDLKAKGFNATRLGNKRMRVKSCPLIINNQLALMSPSKISFNPEIELESTSTTIPSVSQLGLVSVVALLGSVALYKIRRPASSAAPRDAEGGGR